MTHFYLLLVVELIHVSLGLVHEWLGASEGAGAAEGMVTVHAGAMGAAGVDELPLALDVVLELLNGRFCDC